MPFTLSCRYPDEHMDELIDALAKLNDVNRNQVLLGDGSGEILKLCAETFTGPKRGTMVAADPTFEAILNHAQANGAKVVKFRLRTTAGMIFRKWRQLQRKASFTSATRIIPPPASRRRMKCASSSQEFRGRR